MRILHRHGMNQWYVFASEYPTKKKENLQATAVASSPFFFSHSFLLWQCMALKLVRLSSIAEITNRTHRTKRYKMNATKHQFFFSSILIVAVFVCWTLYSIVKLTRQDSFIYLWIWDRMRRYLSTCRTDAIQTVYDFSQNKNVNGISIFISSECC